MHRQANLNGAWAVLLAGGEGTRLQSLTRRIAGDVRPKQFCRILGEESLLTQTRRRVDPLFEASNILAVLTKTHERFYSPELNDWPEAALIAQPENRGTGVAIALAALMPLLPLQGAVPTRSSCLERRRPTRRPNMAGSNRLARFRQSPALRTHRSVSSGRSRIAQRPAIFCRAAVFGIPSSPLGAPAPLSKRCARLCRMRCRCYPRAYLRTIWSQPFENSRRSTSPATSSLRDRNDLWSCGMQRRDGRTWAIRIGFSRRSNVRESHRHGWSL